jgi:hypothetical protein
MQDHMASTVPEKDISGLASSTIYDIMIATPSV